MSVDCGAMFYRNGKVEVENVVLEDVVFWEEGEWNLYESVPWSNHNMSGEPKPAVIFCAGWSNMLEVGGFISKK